MDVTNHKYSTVKEDLFENIIDDKNIMLNHVLIESGKAFPKHPTDAHVYIIVISGELTITLNNEGPKVFLKGDVVEVKKGIESILGNYSKDFTEVFVIKADRN